MSEPGIHAVTMPRWGMTMTEGLLAAWLVEEGAAVAPGQELAEVETTKITNVLEAAAGGTLRRVVVAAGEVAPVGALLGVLAAADVEEAAIARFVAGYDAPAAGAAAVEAGSAARLVEVGEDHVSVTSTGDGDGLPVLLLHGFGGDADAWAFNQDALAATGRAVHALDLPGHGGTIAQVPATLGGLASLVAATLAALGVERVHLIGHSLGGAVALALAELRPGLAASLALVAPAGLGAEIDEGYVSGFIAADRRRPMKEALGRLYADPQRLSGAMIERAVRHKRRDGAPEALRRVAAAFVANGRQSVDLRPALAAFAGPRLVIWGERDRILPSSQAEGLPDTVVVERLAGAAHMPQVEEAGAVNRLLAEHLRRAEGGA